MKALVFLALLMASIPVLGQEFLRPPGSFGKNEKNLTQKTVLLIETDSVITKDTIVVKKYYYPQGKIIDNVLFNKKKSYITGIWNKTYFEDFWGISGKMQRTSVLSGTTKDASGSLYTDLVVDQIGFWRISFASALISAKNDTIRNLQSFLTGGGNAIVKATLPLLLWVNTQNPSQRNAGVYFTPRAAFNIPALGTSSNEFTGNIDLGVELHFILSGDSSKMAFLGRFRSATVYGSKNFTEKFTNDKRQVFGYGQGTIGLLLNKNIIISGSFPISLYGLTDPVDILPISISVAFEF